MRGKCEWSLGQSTEDIEQWEQTSQKNLLLDSFAITFAEKYW